MSLHSEFTDPPREFSLMPFWFWNDRLDETEIVRQMEDFAAHGVFGFIIHPRVGLPRDTGWMSERMLHFVRVAVDAAAERDLKVILYDEGMYPSGSSSGQVVTENPAYACRCLAKVELAGGEPPNLPGGHNLVAVVERVGGDRFAVVDRPADAYIRGLHYVGEGPEEDQPPAADLLNPDAMAAFVRLVHDRYAENLGDHFGSTILGIFTDEPGLLGKCRERDVWPGTTGILEHVSRHLGYDFGPYLAALWYDDEPDAETRRADYRRAVAARLEDTYYRQLSGWCERHGIALCGHPSRGDDIGLLRHFHIPGQDTVWRWVLPDDPTALEGAESTQAKCSSSAMVHLGRRRNSNECFGAYGHEFSWEEMKWLADWCFVRGVNLLFPHAFYYSVRGPRRDERPPDVGPNSTWWDSYRPFADYCRRMCWLNSDSRHVCNVAILGQADRLPWRAARVCFEHQRDFNYVEARHLAEDAKITRDGLSLAGMCYSAVVLDGEAAGYDAVADSLRALGQTARLIHWPGDEEEDPGLGITVRSGVGLTGALDRLAPADLIAEPHAPGLRVRHVEKSGVHYYLLFNEERRPIRTSITIGLDGERRWVDPWTLGETDAEPGLGLELPGYGIRVLTVRQDPSTTDVRRGE